MIQGTLTFCSQKCARFWRVRFHTANVNINIATLVPVALVTRAELETMEPTRLRETKTFIGAKLRFFSLIQQYRIKDNCSRSLVVSKDKNYPKLFC